MDPTVVSEESFVLGRKPVNIFTFTTMAMRMSVYWFVHATTDDENDDSTIRADRERQPIFLTLIIFCLVSFFSFLSFL